MYARFNAKMTLKLANLRLLVSHCYEVIKGRAYCIVLVNISKNKNLVNNMQFFYSISGVTSLDGE